MIVRYDTVCPQEENGQVDGVEVENWSSTHSVNTKLYLQPQSTEEVSLAGRVFSTDGPCRSLRHT